MKRAHHAIRTFIPIIESKIWYICWGNNSKVNCMRSLIEAVMIWDFNLGNFVYLPTWDLCSSIVAAYKLTHMFIKITFLCVSDKKLIRRIKYDKVALDLLTVGKACNVSQFLHEWVYMIDKFEFCRFLILH